MGVFAPSGPPRRWVQDPEALLLLTFEAAREDPRLFDEVLDWLARNESLISVRRLRRLSETDDDSRLLAAVLDWVNQQRRPQPSTAPVEPAGREPEPLFMRGGLPSLRHDPIFRAHGLLRPPAEPSEKSTSPDLTLPINFAFRTRQLLGNGVRAEAMRYLLTADIESATVAEIARAAGYAKRNVQEALVSLHAAGVITLSQSRGEQRFSVERSRWAHLLALDTAHLPIYRDWPRLSLALRRVVRWMRRPELAELSEYLQTSEAADLVDAVRPDLSRAGILLPARIGGERSWTDLEHTIEAAVSSLSPGEGSASQPARLEIVPDESSGHWWRLTGPGGRIVATSAESYRSKRAAAAAAERVRTDPDELSFAVTNDAGVYRWSIVADTGRILAGSSESFTTSEGARRAARVARDLMKSASPPSETPSEHIDQRKRHVTRRPDGRWQVKAEGAVRASSTHATQAAAVRSARQQARNLPGGAEVVVHGRDGRVRSSDVVRPE